MKFKKLLISASAVLAGSGLLATVLTSCSKANVDEKLKIKLDDNGKLFSAGKMTISEGVNDYKAAVQRALSRSASWSQFKTVLAEEIVFNWFTNRMSPSKGSTEKNTTFRTSYDEWEYQINKEYNDTVQNCKNKYGANWKFYLQNEYLAPAGGTEAAYKHAKMVDKIKTDFITRVFAKNYFSYAKEEVKEDAIYPFTYTNATKDIDANTLRNPKNWNNIGFFAKSDLSFAPGDIGGDYSKISPDYLSRHPDGDYAAIQDYVFNRWFATEKPFFSAAALFKYSNPKYVAGGKLDQIYDGTFTGVKIPTDKPSEAFPFFGAGDDSSTKKAVEFIEHLNKGKFATSYTESTSTDKKYNGTITIPKSDSDDGQTLLLCYGNQMMGGANSLYIPYALSAGNLYLQMMGRVDETTNPNVIKDQKFVKDNITDGYKKGTLDDFAILSNFFFADQAKAQAAGITKLLDLKPIYGEAETADKGTSIYHCPLFQENKSYTHFFGEVGKTNGNGIQYITNNIQVAFSSAEEGTEKLIPAQPWVMELNEAGVHAQTIDGYNYVHDDTGDKQEALKRVVKYRLMQKQTNDEAAAIISADLLGENGKLKAYFNDNFATIVLELAMNQEEKYQVFRNIETYKTKDAQKTVDNLFLHVIWKDQLLSKSYDNLVSYIEAINAYDFTKKVLDTLETANSKIYGYRSKQITNSKNRHDFSKLVYENGLLAPLVYAPVANTANGWTYDYASANRIIINYDIGSTSLLDVLASMVRNIIASEFVTQAAEATVNGNDSGFCPQITTAKNEGSNRFWYRSPIVDKVMYTFMGNKTATANSIKMLAYDFYQTQNHVEEWFGDETTSKIWGQASARDAFATTYAKSKLISGDKNISNYATYDEVTSWTSVDDYYTLMYKKAQDYFDKAFVTNGVSCDDIANYELFKATVMYLVANDFENFYKIFDSKIGDDEVAMVAYMTKGFLEGANSLTEPAISVGNPTDYDFNPNVENLFDKTGMSGRQGPTTETEENSKLAVNNYWTVVKKYFEGATNPMAFAGFLGLQTKSSNQLDSASEMQTSVFDKFAKTIKGSVKVGTGKEYDQNSGCWFQFAGSKKDDATLITFDPVTYGETTVTCDQWFPEDDGQGNNYAVVRKVAKKIAEYRSSDDLRTLARTLANAYDGYSNFTPISTGERVFANLEDMKVEMLKLLPNNSAFKDKGASLICFQRVTDAEAHTIDVNPSFIFKDTKTKTGYKVLLTQVNKADIVEKTFAPKWENNKWVANASGVTPEEFWVILFNLASESSVQQRCVTEVVKTAFGDEKLIVYDAQLYNEFDSIWIKDWSKKTLGA